MASETLYLVERAAARGSVGSSDSARCTHRIRPGAESLRPEPIRQTDRSITDSGWVGMRNWRGWMSIVPARCVPASVCLVFCLFYMPPSLIFFAVACRSPVSARHAVRPSHASSSLPTRLARRACGSGSGLSPAASFPAAWPSSPRQFVGMILVSRLQACNAGPSPTSPGPGAFISTAGPGLGLGPWSQ